MLQKPFNTLRGFLTKYRPPTSLAVLLVLLIVVIIILISLPKPEFLTPDERSWLTQHPVVRLSVVSDQPPIFLTDENGREEGILPDLSQRLQKQLQAEFILVKSNTREEALAALKKGDVDAAAILDLPTSGEKDFIYTRPVFEIPLVLINRKGDPTSLALESVRDQVVAIPAGSLIEAGVGKENPNLKVLSVPSDEDALTAVVFRQADLAVLNFYSALELMNRKGFSTLQVSGDLHQNVKIVLLVQPESPILAEILQKGLDSINDTEKQAILNKWYDLPETSSSTSRQVLQVIFIILAVVFLSLLGVLIWNSTLRKTVDRRTRELEESEEKYRLLVENAAEGIIVTYKNSLVFVNQIALNILGYTQEEALNLDLVKLTYPDDRERVWETIAGSMEIGKPAVDYYCRFFAKNGEIRWFYNHTVEILWNGKHSALTFFTDVTEQRKAEEKIQRQMQHLSALRTAESAITASLDQNLTYRILLDQITSQLNVDAVDLLLMNPKTKTLEVADNQGFKIGYTKGTRLIPGKGFAWRAISERKMVRINRDMRDGDHFETPDLKSEGFYSYIGIPLIVKGAVEGVLEVYQRSVLNPDDEWIEFLDAIAGQAAIAIDNASLFEELEHTNLELTISYDATIEGWARALELRDGETEGHSKRVCHMTIKLASAFNISPEEQVQIRRGALLHDIGKMGIPDSILLKPGPLTPEEWKIMRMHPIYGRDLLADIQYLRPALEIPFCHHERWDGTGYPQQLKGEEIPLSARIFMVVDVWDALTSDRPYRDKWSDEIAIRYLEEQSGKQFDPQVVDAFIRMLGWRNKTGKLIFPKV